MSAAVVTPDNKCVRAFSAGLHEQNPVTVLHERLVGRAVAGHNEVGVDINHPWQNGLSRPSLDRLDVRPLWQLSLALLAHRLDLITTNHDDAAFNWVRIGPDD